MTTIRDERTPEQRESMPLLVVGTDRFLSGCGGAEGGASYAAWACCPDNADRVFNWVSRRSDQQRVRLVIAKGYRPGPGCAHLSIYAVHDGHPALR